jgi:hypothetical protein
MKNLFAIDEFDLLLRGHLLVELLPAFAFLIHFPLKKTQDLRQTGRVTQGFNRGIESTHIQTLAS